MTPNDTGPHTSDEDDETAERDRAQLRAIKDTSSVWYWEQDSEFRFTADVRGKDHIPGERSIIGIRRWDAPDCFPLRGTWEDHCRCLEAHLPFRDFEFQVGRGADLRYISTTGVPVFAEGQFVGYRGTAMNITALKRAQQAKERAQALSVLAGRLAKVAGWDLDVPHRRIEWSNGVGELFALPSGFDLTPASMLKLLPREDRRKVLASFLRCTRLGEPFDLEIRASAVGGRLLWLRLVGAPMSARGEMARHVHGALQDISDSKAAQARLLSLGEQLTMLNRELGARVEERTRELEIVNAELKGFAHALAHDLKAPIAAIRGFSSALEGALARDDRARATHLAQRIRAGGERMSGYVDALLSLAETSQAQLSFTEVDLSAMCAEIVDGLRAGDKERAVAVAIEDGMSAVGDRRLLHVLLENLIGNAWKFTSRRPDAWIGISSAPDPSAERVFSVRDNGAGFDMAFADKLFGSFQRLHAADEFPGTGIGLANAQRIVTRHGGRIWAQSSQDAGTIFSFTLGTGPLVC